MDWLSFKSNAKPERPQRVPKKGFGKLWSRLTGKYSDLKAQNEHDAWQALRRDQSERDKIIAKQLDERQRLQAAINKQREERLQELVKVRQQIANYMMMKQGKQPKIMPKDAAEAVRQKSKAQEKTRNERKKNGRERSRKRDRGPSFER